jgi:hypothetical protein
MTDHSTDHPNQAGRTTATDHLQKHPSTCTDHRTDQLGPLKPGGPGSGRTVGTDHPEPHSSGQLR